jgi:hypothetical protein
MCKHTAKAHPANFNFARAYFEVKRLREDIERIEKSSEWQPSQPIADRKLPTDDHRAENRLHS